MNIEFASSFQKDLKKIKKSPYFKTLKELIVGIQKNPFQTPTPYEKLKGINIHTYSRRINIQHRLVYIVIDSKIIFISCWGHYE